MWEAFKGETTLIISTSENNLEVKNCTKIDDKNESTQVYKLSDIFSNNINFELSKISILSLENCNLSDIPSNIQKLNLKQLFLARNKFSEVPSFLYSGLNTLELLDLSYNFIESFDIEPACSCTIVTLKLNNNRIRNFPHWILNLRCPKLEKVVYSNNGVKDLRASHQLNMKIIEMCNCQLIDVDFPFFKSLRNLESLDISNTLTNDNENHFKNFDLLFRNTRWNNLKVLNLSNNAVSILPEGLFWITSLTELYLNNCDLSWIPSAVQYLTALRILEISNNAVCSLPSELNNLKNLVVIKAAFNDISSVVDLSHDIEILDLYSNSLETCPTCAKNAKLVDLEQNFFETKEDEDYMQKRDQLRQVFSYCRTNSSRELPEPPRFEDNSSGQHDYSDSDCSIKYGDFNSDSDDWNDEKLVIFKEKNPEITSSDDEWDGKAEVLREKVKEKKVSFEIHEEWIFCDAEE